MIEVFGDVWDYYGKLDTVICVTTNGFVRKTGQAVMGRGVAQQARDKLRGIDRELGAHINKNGNVPGELNRGRVLSFPTKHMFFEKSDPKLILQSANALNALALKNKKKTFVLPRPGCSNGGLVWKDVKHLVNFLPDNVLVIDLEPEESVR